MKTELMEHQRRALEALDGREFLALFCEQGTGKTVMLLADAERLHLRGEIDTLVVIAPKGVHRNWITREAKKHLSCDWRAAIYQAGNKKAAASVDQMLRAANVLRIFAINIDAVNTKNGLSCITRVLRESRAMLVVDESQRIKNVDAKRTKKTLSLRALAPYRRIASGRPITKAPQDIYSQFEFLQPGLFPVKTYRAFVARYCSVLPEWHPLVQHIMAKSRARRPPQLIEKDDDGNVILKNESELKRIIAENAFVVKKADCLDLPPKVFRVLEFDLSPRHRAVYDRIAAELRYIDADKNVIQFENEAVRTKLRQITSGFILNGESEILPFDENPRIDLLREVITDLDAPFIVWASFVEELHQVRRLLDEIGIESVLYYGGTPDDEREAAIDRFQSGEVRAFVGNPSAAGTGLTLTAAETAIFFSNTDNAGDRSQAEDRCHRIGSRTDKSVLYIDLVASGTVDDDMLRQYRAKIDLGDNLIRPST